ncbi:MAG: DHA2 family efflux MFS transporter permease subunit [Solirubrobacteraceae bacterium]|nr:DHA2 family efflux MFS transporter permease subunit [Solirubrobacteraceae bacterium]
MSPAANTRWLGLGVLCLALLAIVVDNTIVNVALPTLAGELQADTSRLQWVVDAYTLTFAGLLMAGGALGDRIGRRSVLVGGLLVFGVASALAALAGGADALIAARAAMGIGAAFVMPATLSLLVPLFPDERERATAVGVWAATAGIGVALGPVVGGLLLEHFSWGAIFLVNVPLVALAIIGGLRLLPESRDPEQRPVDWLGAALSGAGLVALVWAVIEGPADGWTSSPVLAGTVIGAVLLVAFGWWQTRTPHPLLDVRLFRDARFSAASTAIMVLFFGLFGFLFLATQYLQFVLGLSPLSAGVHVLPYAGAMIVSASLAAKVAEALGPRRVVALGMALFAAGLGVAGTLTIDSGYGLLAIALVLLGTGMGLAGTTATESILGSLPPERANVGSAVNDTTRELGGALGVAVIGSVASSLYSGALTDAAPAQVPTGALEAASGSLDAAVRLGPGIAQAAQAAFVDATATASLVAMAVVAVGVVAAWRFLPAAEPSAVRNTPETAGLL